MAEAYSSQYCKPNSIPDVSVVMAVRNGAATLEFSIASVLAQSFGNWELIVVDDASTDAFEDVIARFPDSRIRVLRNSTNEGLAASLNTGIGAATAPYIARMDSDDICYPNRIEKQLAFLRSYPSIDLVGAAMVIFQEEGLPIGVVQGPVKHLEICKTGWRGAFSMYHPTWMGRKEWFQRNPYDPTFTKAQDFELLLRAAPTSQYANLPDVLLGYRTDRVVSLRKRLVTRRHVLKALAKNVGFGGGALVSLQCLAATALKGVLDIVAFLQQSAFGPHLGSAHLSPCQQEEWARVWSSATRECVPLICKGGR